MRAAQEPDARVSNNLGTDDVYNYRRLWTDIENEKLFLPLTLVYANLSLVYIDNTHVYCLSKVGKVDLGL